MLYAYLYHTVEVLKGKVVGIYALSIRNVTRLRKTFLLVFFLDFFFAFYLILMLCLQAKYVTLLFSPINIYLILNTMYDQCFECNQIDCAID